MDLNDILAFTKVVETRSFTGAAEALGLPKSTVSRRLAQLEERLGVRLIQRTTRKVSVTEIGEAYYERCARLVADLALAEQVVTDMQTTPRGRLRVTAPVDFSTACLGAVIAGFVSEYREISIELDATDRVVDLIDEGFDVAVRFSPPSDPALDARRLCAIEGGLVAAPSYLARRGMPTTLDELEAHDRLLFVPSPRFQGWTLTDGSSTYEFGRPARLASNNFGAVQSAVLAGAGIAAMTDFIVARDIEAGRLVPVMPAWRGRGVAAHLVYPTRAKLPPRLSLFFEHLARSFDPVPWSASARRALVSIADKRSG
ncbi:MAG TPA: LysR family transcriptional regulator [Kofleriaceae bacterium]|nr:LysR family transcriptional regulator [Kofleriaceae bacterium]